MDALESLRQHIETSRCLVDLQDCPVGLLITTVGEVQVRYSMSQPRLFTNMAEALEHIQGWLQQSKEESR